MRKNQWSLAACTERDISQTIFAIEELGHSEEDFTQLLALKESFEKERLIPQPQQLLKILNCRAKKREEETSNLCTCCFQFISHKHWCKICGNSTCRKCLIRERQLKDETRTLFCQKCDQQYLKAMDGIELYNKTEKLERAFRRLIQEQEGIEKLVSAQREKQISNGTNFNELATKGAMSERLAEENKILKVRCSEISKKIEFGKIISRDLRKKLHELRKKQKQSFGTLSNHEEQKQVFAEHEKDELNLSGDNRESILTMTDRADHISEEDNYFPKKCKCDIF